MLNDDFKIDGDVSPLITRLRFYCSFFAEMSDELIRSVTPDDAILHVALVTFHPTHGNEVG